MSALMVMRQLLTGGNSVRDGCISKILSFSLQNLRTRILGNKRKFRRHFKGSFSIGNVRVRSLPSILLWPGIPKDARTGRKSRLFLHSVLSPGSQLVNLGGPNAESLRLRPQIFPFCGDCRRRLSAITKPPASRGQVRHFLLSWAAVLEAVSPVLPPNHGAPPRPIFSPRLLGNRNRSPRLSRDQWHFAQVGWPLLERSS
jgi:hypothetical protein